MTLPYPLLEGSAAEAVNQVAEPLFWASTSPELGIQFNPDHMWLYGIVQ